MDAPILDQVVLSYCPVIDRERRVMTTRLTVFPIEPGVWLPVGELLHAISDVWPADGPSVALSVRSEALLADLLSNQPTSNVMLEIPKFMAADPQHLQAVQTLSANGNVLLLSGRPNHPLPFEVLRCFKYSIIDLADERRLDEKAPPPPNIKRTIGFFQDGVRTVAQMEGAFRRGAVAIVGWPIDAVVQEHSRRSKVISPDQMIIIELLNQVEREEPIAKLEATLRREPTLAYKLMRYINSPVFGLSVSISSFGHAVMLLGYQRLKRWLALLLVTAHTNTNLRPVMFAAIRRGLMMERLARPDATADQRSELFICGVFSLLDRIFQQPFAQLLDNIPVPDAIYQALVHDSGPFLPLLELVRCVEGGAGIQILEAASRADISPRHVNRALLGALASTGEMMV